MTAKIISYRDNLKKIGNTSTRVAWSDFISHPPTLRQAIKSMSIPATFRNSTENFVDQRWTEECQGVAWDGTHWLFTSNGGSSSKKIYSFNNKNNPELPNQSLDLSSIPTPPSGKLYHVGALIVYKNRIYIDHWRKPEGQDVCVLQFSQNRFTFRKWIPLESVDRQRVGLVAINPWDDKFYTSFGDTEVDRLFIHNNDGSFTGREMRLSPGITNGGFVQGGTFSANGHLYIAAGKKNLGQFQHIYCYSALNGKLLDTIPVLSSGSGQELEGLCYADVSRNNKRSQLHVVLLENILIAGDNIFFKSFAASEPDLV